ncbi:MAG TPA: Spy/CpxP family protein refolding chaperone [Anaeromyxobacteraceae bacterium]|nr:Spy/CpxP family protein refolding chaperone [Anaeromyxobacteraceae bacterium]
MKKTVPVLLGLAALFALATGFRGGCGGHRHDPASIDRMVTAHLEDALEDLDATPAQKGQVMALKDRVLQKGLALRQGGQETKKALVAQWDSASPDRAAVHALVDARIDAMRAFAHEAADAAVDLHGILTPEQRAKISKKVHRHME